MAKFVLYEFGPAINEGSQIYQIKHQTFRICMACYRQKLTVWPGKSILCKKTPHNGYLVDTILGYLTLEGSGRQKVDTRSTSVLPLNTWGYDGSN